MSDATAHGKNPAETLHVAATCKEGCRGAEADLIAAWLRRMAHDPGNDTSTRTVLDIAAALVDRRAHREDR